MKIELRKIEYFAAGSEETSCYAAKVYVDGKHVADVRNEGHGGCDHQHPAKGFNHAYLVELEKRIAAEFPAPFEIEGKPVPADLESVCGDLRDNYLQGRDLKRHLTGKVLFTNGDGKVMQVAFKGVRSLKGETLTKALKIVRADHPTATILNELPFDDALAVYRKEGAA